MATCSGSRAQSTVSTEPTAASWSQPNPEPHRPHRAAPLTEAADAFLSSPRAASPNAR
jgi:hypothetical protein